MEKAARLRFVLNWVFLVILGFLIFVAPLLLHLPPLFSFYMLVLMMWSALTGIVLLTRLGTDTVAPWRMKVAIIGLPPVASLFTALAMPFDSLPLLVTSLLVGVVLSWVLVKASRVDNQMKAAPSTAS